MNSACLPQRDGGGGGGWGWGWASTLGSGGRDYYNKNAAVMSLPSIFAGSFGASHSSSDKKLIKSIIYSRCGNCLVLLTWLRQKNMTL